MNPCANFKEEIKGFFVLEGFIHASENKVRVETALCVFTPYYIKNVRTGQGQITIIFMAPAVLPCGLQHIVLWEVIKADAGEMKTPFQFRLRLRNLYQPFSRSSVVYTAFSSQTAACVCLVSKTLLIHHKGNCLGIIHSIKIIHVSFYY